MPPEERGGPINIGDSGLERLSLIRTLLWSGPYQLAGAPLTGRQVVASVTECVTRSPGCIERPLLELQLPQKRIPARIGV